MGVLSTIKTSNCINCKKKALLLSIISLILLEHVTIATDTLTLVHIVSKIELN